VAGYFSGQRGPSGIRSSEHRVSGFRIQQNYPNPFNGTTLIRFEVATEDHIRLTILDILGRVVGSEDLGMCEPGDHVRIWPNADTAKERLSSGVYFYRIEGTRGEVGEMQKMILMN
jgi:flagellar hook assembly protein FlgD